MTDQAAVPTVGTAVVPVAIPAAPVAKRVPSERTHHGDTVVDDYAWLADKTDPDTIAYLTAENEYTAARTHDQAPLREAIFNEIKSRTQETDLTVPTRHAGYWYYTRTVEGQQYAIHCRRAVAEGELAPPVTDDGGPLEGEEILLDGNAEAAGSEFFAMGTFDVSPDTHLLAYSVDLTGDERFTLRVKDLRTGAVLPDEVSNVFYGSAWSLDASSLFYLTVDEAWRPYRVWRHALGSPATEDVLVYEEPDERFWVGVGLTRSEQFIVIDAHSKVTSEVRLIPATAPTADPVVVAPRRQGVEYNVEHDPGADRLLVLHNDDAEDFALAVTSATAPGAWTPLVPHTSGVRLLDVDAFADHIVVSLRRDGLTALRVLPREGEPFDISFPEPIHTVGLGENPEYATTTIRLHYASLITPDSVYDYDLGTRSFTLLKRRPVLGDFDPDAYEQHREWAIAPDGTRVPISLVCRRDVARDGTAPTVLYGYGSYETSMDPWFSVARLSLLDRGVVFAVAHVRGGGELGRRWYTDGRLLTKKNTFTDFVACAQHLAQSGWTSPDRLIARGGSAGGLLMGAVANLAPAAFGGIVAEVPFVDNLSTILDPSLPLTVIEWEEWGNPLADAEAYEYIKSYGPYENVRPAPSPESRRSSRGKERSAGSLATYPPILAVTSLNDTRVFFHEPAKWIARLRAVAPDGDYLLKTELEAGHGGRSGRYDAWHEEAFILAWLLTRFASRRS